MSIDIPGPLPKFERILAWSVWIFHSFAAFVIAFWVSNGKLKEWIKHWLHDSSYVDGYRMDLADAEWQYYRKTVFHLIVDYLIHSICIRFAKHFLSPKYCEYFVILIGFLVQIHMSSVQCVIVLYSFAAIVTLLTLSSRYRIIPWFLCILFITKASKYVPFSNGDNQIFYREFNIYLYGAIKILNFCLHLCSNPDKKYEDVMVSNLLYYSYLPYSMTLIVTFEDYVKQFGNWMISNDWKHLKSTLFFGVRLIFWFLFFEFLLHFIHVNALFNSPFTVINGLNVYEVCAVAYVAGQFFHLKYVVIFGIPSFFAYLDGMRPPPPPICISRVSLYSRMWRYFDNGLYQFLKHHVYIPVLKKPLPPILSLIRNFGALCAVFGVVLAWHGTRSHYIYWVCLSAAELIVERIGYQIWRLIVIQDLRRRVGENCTRRVIATSMILTVTPGIFGVFFFLGQEGVGETILNNVVIQGLKDVFSWNLTCFPLSAGFGFLHILTLGYFFNNVCIDIEFFQ